MEMLHYSDKSNRQAAFSRNDLLAVLLVLAVMGGGVFAWVRHTHVATSTVCAANLNQLGMAMAMYEQNNSDRLPYAYLEFGPYKIYDASKQVWDSLIFPYVPTGPNGLTQKHLLRCPADIIPGFHGEARRTYAMPSHANKGDNWPLSAENATGVGVWYSRWEKRKDLTNYISVVTTQKEGTEEVSTVATMPAFKLDMIHVPSSTLLLTEHAEAENVAFNFHGATIESQREHLGTNLDLELYHGGKINYLMVDGHVELLYPMESAGQADPRDSDARNDYPNIWTINK